MYQLIKKINFFILSSLFIVHFSTTFAMENPTATDELLQHIHHVSSYQADFTQTVVDKSTGNKSISYGTLWVKQPNFFKWEVLKPNKQLLVSNGKKLWNYDMDLEQVTIQDVPKRISNAPILLLLRGDPKTLDELFYIYEGKNNTFTLIPKDKEAVAINKIILYFDNGNLRKLTLRTSTGIDTYILFDDYSYGKINTSFFDFKAPKGVDVLGSASE
ncbi:outer membrane lipoprotein chaperone LolA [Thiotrichales bacterium 19S3-7]|nr:outer membrane lipoprotein chaperone LolA [Thiotrichales bacterium 19S3-7]MCF6800665.1 outer membrane lipoprotein chaperone LolA [Thiotrichales bacterium 19S3-11]